MKRFSALALISVATVIAGSITATIDLDPDRLNLSTFEDYDIITLPQAIQVPDPGKPSLPLITATLVIPADARLTSAKVEPLATRQINGRFNILPAQNPVPISQIRTLTFVPPDPQIYSSDRPYPDHNIIYYSTGTAAGFKLVSLIISPFSYYPVSGRLLFHNQLKITVNYQPDNQPPLTLYPSQKERVAQSLQNLVLNPEQLMPFSPPAAEKDQPRIDLLVITSPELAPFFRPYQEYKKTRGLITEIRTTDWIERNYPGRDIKEKIRNHIIDYFHNRGISYVLLAGDNRQVPSRQIRVIVGNEQGSIPSDLYYGDLDYSWDSNHNNLFGEMEDSVDLYADVFVGRAAVDNQTQVENFFAKVRTFENLPAPDYIKRSLLPSGWLWRSLNYHGRFVNDSIASLTPADWIDRKLENPASARVVADSFDHGFLIFDPAGHGNEAGVYDEDGTPIYTSGYAANQQNQNRLSIITSLACNPGNFEAEDCLAEVALNCPNAGAIAVMMNSRYGWGTPPSMGPSEKLCIRFYDHLLNFSEFQLGPCHNRSREEYAGAALYSSLWRWCLTEFNLLGDPTIDIWTETPRPLSITTPDTIVTGSQSLTVTVLEGSSPASGATVTAYKENEVLATGYTNASGHVNINIHPLTAGELRITATRHNNLPAMETVCVTTGNPEPVLVNVKQEIDDSGQANPNGILEPGETARLKLTIKNIGTAPATSTRLLLRSIHPDISVLDSISTAGIIPPGDSFSAENLTVSASLGALPGSSPEFLLIINSDQNEWQHWFSITLGYPGRTWADIDTGTCALSITARGTIGYDLAENRQGRGFRYPKADTSGLNIASFVFGNSPDYIADCFYNQNDFDQDWQLQDSIRTCLPIWNADVLLQSGFNDLGHPAAKNIAVDQHAIGLDQPGLDNLIILVYDILNTGTNGIDSLYAGIIADFDIIPTDRLHDLAYTLPELNTAFMRNVNSPNRYLGIKLLYPQTRANLTCIDHSRYVYPDSAMTEDMKFRLLTGTLGLARADRPYNWSISVAAGPFALPGNSGRQRIAFAFIGAPDSASYLTTCQVAQDWFNANVGISDKTACASNRTKPNISIAPNPFTKSTTIHYQLPAATPVRITAFDITGRTVATLLESKQTAGNHQLIWRPEDLAHGIYFIKIQTASSRLISRVLLLN
ncbi:MAG: C25 family cysteine peptidase [bacterium]